MIFARYLEIKQNMLRRAKTMVKSKCLYTLFNTEVKKTELVKTKIRYT